MTNFLTALEPNPNITDYYAGTITEEPALSQSCALSMLRSHKHGWSNHPRFGGKPKRVSAKMELGTIIDEVMLGGSKRIGVVTAVHPKTFMPVTDFKTNAAKEERDKLEAAGLHVITHAKRVAIEEMAAKVEESLRYDGIELNGLRQCAVFWVETASNGNEVQCCGLLDHFDTNAARIDDLKTLDNGNPDKIPYKAIAGGWHIQAAAYTRGVEKCFPALAGRVKFRNLAVETDWPYVATIYRPTNEVMELGRMLWQWAVDSFEHCVRTGYWQPYARRGEVLDYDLPNAAKEQYLAMLEEAEERASGEGDDDGDV